MHQVTLIRVSKPNGPELGPGRNIKSQPLRSNGQVWQVQNMQMVKARTLLLYGAKDLKRATQSSSKHVASVSETQAQVDRDISSISDYRLSSTDTASKNTTEN